MIRKIRLILNLWRHNLVSKQLHTLPNISQSIGNHTRKFFQSIEYNKRTIFLHKSRRKWCLMSLGRLCHNLFNKQLQYTLCVLQLLHIPWRNGNQTMSFQLTEYNKRNIFLQKSCRKYGRKTNSRPLYFLKKLYIR